MDLATLRALRGGDAAAFARAVRLLAPSFRRLAVRYFRSPFEQEEAVQEAFLLLYRRREAIDPLRLDELEGFANTLARRRMIDLARAQRPAELIGEEALEGTPDTSRDPFEKAADAQLQAMLAELEGKLKPAYRPFFRAVFVDGKDFDQARAELGIGRLRAKYLKHVLLARLRRHGPIVDYLKARRA